MSNPFFAQAEETRGEGNVRFAIEIAGDPTHPMADALPVYGMSARAAFESAAANAEQPSGWAR